MAFFKKNKDSPKISKKKIKIGLNIKFVNELFLPMHIFKVTD
jgi:hypothetical protein